MEDSIWNLLGLQALTNEEWLKIYGDEEPRDSKEQLDMLLSYLPDNIKSLIEAALQQLRPFLPPDITPQMMAAKNERLSPMNQIDILNRCVHLACKAGEYQRAACIAFAVDRAAYWSGTSRSLLQVVDLIKQNCPDVVIAPQIQVRKARVLKDDGDYHGAMTVLDQVSTRSENNPGEWKYADEDQFLNTKAETIKIKGHILHNMGGLPESQKTMDICILKHILTCLELRLMKGAVEPIIKSIELFKELQIPDEKGIASSLGILTKCLGKISLQEYAEVQNRFPVHFQTDHPYHESYIQGKKAVQFIESLKESLYSSRHLLDAESSLLKYAILRPTITEEYALFETIIAEMKKCLSAHKTVDALRSSEQFFEFVRALFIISLTLGLSPVYQDRCFSEYLQQLSMELYSHLCNHDQTNPTARLGHSQWTLSIINHALTMFGIPGLTGVPDEDDTKVKDDVQSTGVPDEDDTKVKDSVQSTGGEATHYSDISREEETDDTGIPVDDNRKFKDGVRSTNREATDLSREEGTDHFCLGSAGGNRKSTTETKESMASNDQDLSQSNSEEPDGRFMNATSPTDQAADPIPPTSPTDQTSDQIPPTSPSTCHDDTTKSVSSSRARRCWTYSFAPSTCPSGDTEPRVFNTFPQMNKGGLLDPKKQWQTYKHKCVGLPVDPNLFAMPVPIEKDLPEADVYDSSQERTSGKALVNLSVPYIQQTVENLTSDSSEVSSKQGSLDLGATTADYSLSSERPMLHPHDIPNQPMRATSDQGKNYDDGLDGSGFDPLIDLTTQTFTDSFEALKLGESIETADPIEYMTNWKAPDTERDLETGVHRAFLLSYNPTTSDWSAQSTLAYIGDPLDLAANQKGNCRDAFHVQFLHQDEPRGRYVGKRYAKKKQRDLHDPQRYMQDVVCQMMAGYYVTKFNEALQNFKKDIKVQYLPAAHLQLVTHDNIITDCFNVEPFLHGSFKKLTNNTTFASRKGGQFATALTHFSYCESKGTLMIVDIQGWLPGGNGGDGGDGSGVIYLTDPQFHTSGMEKFSPYDHQERGMEAFWKQAHPVCNDMCKALGLERPMQFP